MAYKVETVKQFYNLSTSVRFYNPIEPFLLSIHIDMIRFFYPNLVVSGVHSFRKKSNHDKIYEIFQRPFHVYNFHRKCTGGSHCEVKHICFRYLIMMVLDYICLINYH